MDEMDRLALEMQKLAGKVDRAEASGRFARGALYVLVAGIGIQMTLLLWHINQPYHPGVVLYVGATVDQMRREMKEDLTSLGTTVETYRSDNIQLASEVGEVKGIATVIQRDLSELKDDLRARKGGG